MFNAILTSLGAALGILGGSSTSHTYNLTNKITLTVYEGDITQSCTQAIVNAANPQLQGGGGVCGAIFTAAGWQAQQEACDKHPIVQEPDVRCPVGQARMTENTSGQLRYQGVSCIIHAVGPDCRIVHDESTQDELLYQAYMNTLLLADQHGITSITFPFISTSIYGFPKERAAKIALKAMQDYAQMSYSKVTDIRMVLFADPKATDPHEDMGIWKQLLFHQQRLARPIGAHNKSRTPKFKPA